MRRRKVRLLSLVLALALTALVPLPAYGWQNPPEPTLVDRNPSGSVGDWYLGATPPNVDPSRPVLVFVHGLNGSALGWWGATAYHGTNDMYAYAYNHGYRTAFVNLGGDKSMWYNGDLLNRMLGDITSHFGVSKVSLVAHSKGGVDSNSASAHYGAASRIRNIITLGTPHWGSPLADLAYSTWTSWLAEILGYRSDAVYVMQTGYMEYFRSLTDDRDPTVSYYTLSGYKCGPFLSAYWWGCAFISGEDDGVVPVWSTRKPGGTHVVEGHWDHDEIKMGSRTWSWFVPYLLSGGTQAAVAAGATGTADATGDRPAAPGNLILRGGDTAGVGADATFPVEGGVQAATFTFLATSPHFTATLTAPDGRIYTVAVKDQLPADHVFAGAWVGSVTVKEPAAGQWTVRARAPGQAGYLMVAALDSQLQMKLDLGKGVARPGSRRTLAVTPGPGLRPRHVQADAVVSLSGGRPWSLPVLRAGAAGRWEADVRIPEAPGIHNVTVTVTGTAADGTAFERTLVSSFAAVPEELQGYWTGP